jgi:hypothetical protein
MKISEVFKNVYAARLIVAGCLLLCFNLLALYVWDQIILTSQ